MSRPLGQARPAATNGANGTRSAAAGAAEGGVPPTPPRDGGADRGTVALLAALLLAALGLRLWSIDHGLPFAYNADEELHFVPIAVDMFAGSFNPGYFENPPALTYLFHLMFRLRFTEGFPFGGGGFRPAFLDDPTAAYLTARVLVALIGTLVVGLVFWAGTRLYERRVGLVAAALMAFAFLPVFYSKFALNDVVTLAPVTVALVGCLLAAEHGRGRDWILAGAAVGVATATKYTAGAMLLAVAVAAVARLGGRRDRVGRVAVGLVLAGVAFVVAFLVLNPFSLAEPRTFLSQVVGQSGQAAVAKLGQPDTPGWVYYAWTLTWGLGVVPAVAAVAGAVLALRGDRLRGFLLVAFPVALFLFLGAQGRFFGRWLLPAYPALCVLAAVAAVWLADRAPRRLRPALLTGLAVLLVGQGLLSAVRIDRVLGREDTRSQARAWLTENVPRGTGVVVEPFVPRGWLTLGGREAPERFRRFPIKRPFQAYERRLSPELVERYRREGYCWVVIGSHQRDRGLSAGLENARAYYARLEGESERRALFSPYRPADGPVGFNFDLSFNYLHPAYERPGPLIEVRELRDCGGRRA